MGESKTGRGRSPPSYRGHRYGHMPYRVGCCANNNDKQSILLTHKCPGLDSNQHAYKGTGPQPAAYTYSATGARWLLYSPCVSCQPRAFTHAASAANQSTALRPPRPRPLAGPVPGAVLCIVDLRNPAQARTCAGERGGVQSDGERRAGQDTILSYGILAGKFALG